MISKWIDHKFTIYLYSVQSSTIILAVGDVARYRPAHPTGRTHLGIAKTKIPWSLILPHLAELERVRSHHHTWAIDRSLQRSTQLSQPPSRGRTQAQDVRVVVRSIGPASRGASLVAVACTNVLRIRTGTPAGARRLAVTHTRSPILSSSPRRARAFFPSVLARQLYVC